MISERKKEGEKWINTFPIKNGVELNFIECGISLTQFIINSISRRVFKESCFVWEGAPEEKSLVISTNQLVFNTIFRPRKCRRKTIDLCKSCRGMRN